MEQEREFMKGEINQLRGNFDKKSGEMGDMAKVVREKDDICKKMKDKKKKMEKEIQEIKKEKDQMEMSFKNMQNMNSNSVDAGKLESMQKENESLKMERMYLQNQLNVVKSQNDENKRL